MSKKEMESKYTLLTEPIDVEDQNPKRLMIYSRQKVGKTTLLAGLNGCAILDFEKGTRFVKAIKYQIDDLDDLRKIGSMILKGGKPYPFIAIDTVTALEEMVHPLAKQLYRETPMGRGFGYKVINGERVEDKDANILTLPNGGGYLYLRNAFFNVLDYIDNLADYIILVGHLKDKAINAKGEEVSAIDIDLTGKIGSMLCSKVDAIGVLSRKDEKTNVLSFKTSDIVACGARPAHLKNQEIIISELMDDGVNVKTHWDRIYI